MLRARLASFRYRCDSHGRYRRVPFCYEMNLHLYRKRKAPDRREDKQQYPYACSVCQKNFACVEHFKSHRKQSSGHIYADWIERDTVAQAQASAAQARPVMQAPDMRRTRPKGDRDRPAKKAKGSQVAADADDGKTEASASALATEHAPPYEPLPDKAKGRNRPRGTPWQVLCPADRACPEASEQQGPWAVPLYTSEAQVSTAEITFSQAAISASPGSSARCAQGPPPALPCKQTPTSTAKTSQGAGLTMGPMRLSWMSLQVLHQ